MSISTRLTDLLKVQHPILLAPMDIDARVGVGFITWSMAKSAPACSTSS
jgi:hypothetical protein